MKKMVIAGGCFWCIESDFSKLDGIISVTSGYIGGGVVDANYEAVCSGMTDHREAVEVTYDEKIITFKALIEYYWTCIDPTNPYGQFADLGPQYKTAIYYADDEEKMIIETSKEALNNSGRFDHPVATDVLPLTKFYEAESYHQDYYKKNPDHYNRYRVGSGRAGFIMKHWGDKRNDV